LGRGDAVWKEIARGEGRRRTVQGIVRAGGGRLPHARHPPFSTYYAKDCGRASGESHFGYRVIDRENTDFDVN